MDLLETVNGRGGAVENAGLGNNRPEADVAAWNSSLDAAGSHTTPVSAADSAGKGTGTGGLGTLYGAVDLAVAPSAAEKSGFDLRSKARTAPRSSSKRVRQSRRLSRWCRASHRSHPFPLEPRSRCGPRRTRSSSR
jgi:hypothetical protein